ncbi:MAG TPA: ATP-binding cassette domain-containing protein [Burkholderiales bacterium]|nr:ATP-binding cassette domain-containing protein [Burkholderiales bacterium]
MLKVDNLDAHIEKTQILRKVSFELPQGAMAGLIGRNGAGKTTLMRSIMGLIRPTGGRIQINGADVTAVPGHLRASMRVGYMPEDRRLVPELTVEENVMIPAWANGISDAKPRLERIYQLMPEVKSFAERRALQLSGGQQKLVAFARALMTGDNLILLDEPFEGIAPALSRRLAEVLQDLKGKGASVLLSESDYTHSADLVDKLFVIERGVLVEKELERRTQSPAMSDAT